MVDINSFENARDERELTEEIWLLAASEAYGARDGVRRHLEMLSLTHDQVVELYLKENPEIKRWFDRNVAAGTCATAAAELREKMQEYRKEMQRQAEERLERPPAGPPTIFKLLSAKPINIPMRAMQPPSHVDAKAEPDPTQPYKTGAPGRPTSMNLIFPEMIRRAAAGEMITDSLAKEADELSKWLRATHPEAPAVKAKTIRNQLSRKWRDLGGISRNTSQKPAQKERIF